MHEFFNTGGDFMKKFRQLLALFCMTALVFSQAAAASSVSLLTSLMGTHLINPTYADYDASSDSAQHFDAALVILDAAAGEDTGKLWYSLTGAQYGSTIVYAVEQENAADHKLSFLYFLNRDVWLLTMDTDDGLIVLEYLEELNADATEEEAGRIVSQRNIKGRMLNSDYFWQHVIHVIVTLQESAAQSAGSGQPAQSYGWGSPVFREPVTQAPERGWPVTVNLCVEMTITDEMSDFIFSINGETTVPAVADKEAGQVTGSFTVTQNGLYVVFLGYKYNGNEIEERVEINIDQVDEQAFSEHEHTYVLTVLSEHPHIKIACSECGEAYSYADSHQGPGYSDIPIRAAGCCECGLHTLEDVYYEGKILRVCMFCNQRQELTNAESLAWQDYVDLISLTGDFADVYRSQYGVDVYGSSPWRILANQGVDLLQDRGFVFWTELASAYANPAGTLFEAGGDMIASEDDYTRLKIDLWKDILHETLEQTPAKSNSADVWKSMIAGYDFTDGTAGTMQWAKEVAETHKVSDWRSFSANAGSSMKRIADGLESDYYAIKQDYDILRANQSAATKTLGASTDPGYIERRTWAAESKVKADSLAPDVDGAKQHADKVKGQSKLIDAVPYVLVAIESVLAGTDKASEAVAIRDNYVKMACEYEHYKNILFEIMDDAAAMKNDEMYTAAEEVFLELTDERQKYYHKLTEQLNGVLFNIANAADEAGTAAIAFGEGAGATAVTGLSNIALDAALGAPFAFVSFAAGGVNLISHNDNISRNAQTLMAYTDMTSSMNLHDTLGANTEDDYVYQLWANLQIRGCESAQEFAKSFDKGLTGLDMDTILPDEDDLESVIDMLDLQIDLYDQFLSRRTGK